MRQIQPSSSSIEIGANTRATNDASVEGNPVRMSVARGVAMRSSSSAIENNTVALILATTTCMHPASIASADPANTFAAKLFRSRYPLRVSPAQHIALKL